MKRGVGVLFLIAALSGCFGNPPPIELDFATSPGIFRGTYQGEADMRVSSSDVSLDADGSLLAMGNGDFFHAVYSCLGSGAVEATCGATASSACWKLDTIAATTPPARGPTK